MISVSENFLVESEWSFLQNKICPFLAQGMFRYIDDFLSLNNSRFCDFVDRIYHIELEIKDTTDTDRSAQYFDLHLDIYPW
jgi:hypothetical protein